MWLKSYLSFGPDRPVWALFADALFALRVPLSERNVDPEIRMNIFLQTWHSYTNNTQIPDLKILTDTAKKFGLRIEGIAFLRGVIRQMPIWYHKEADPTIRTLNHTQASQCLKKKHAVRNVGDAEALANMLRNSQHTMENNCMCEQCTHLRTNLHCEHPQGCMKQALKLINTLPPKWDPRSVLPEDYQRKPRETEPDWIIFDNRVTTNGTLADIFRLFTDPKVTPVNTLPDLKIRAPEDADTGNIIVATNGSCYNNGEDNAHAGAGIYVGPDHQMNRSAKLPLYIGQSNQNGELVATKLAAELADP
ncbi:hypothetical protein K435DRAFT_613767, partial [Dendrothele bispora CBS 962.96]